ncbi:alkaline phosphatase family protein [Vibrio kyushuensis]|uniref:alkaline phosphatase family protein n=1 Tax=Vibrio kyushuensis TaxID=2910249 RepID=UPI003D136BD8
MEKTILVVLDAFRHDYVNSKSTPFLYSLLSTSKYYKKLTPSYGFCERTELMVGLEANESNYFTAIGYDEKNSPYKHISGVLRILSKIEKASPNIVRKVIRRLLWEYISRRNLGFSSVNIPMESLVYFSLTEDGEGSIINESPASIINFAKRHDKSVNLSSFTSLDSKMAGNDDDRISNLIEQLNKTPDSIYLLYISAADHYGHKYGPDSDSFKDELQKLDKKLKKLYHSVNKSLDDVNWMFVGDHGMTQIEHKLDVVQDVDSVLSDYRFGDDYIYFADSTVFRLWCLDKSKAADIEVKLEKLFSQTTYKDKGRMTTERELGLIGDRTYGDLLWLTNPGVVVNPDFFNTASKELNGMHGYDPLLSETCLGMGILNGKRFKPEQVASDSLVSIYRELKIIVSDEDAQKC